MDGLRAGTSGIAALCQIRLWGGGRLVGSQGWGMFSLCRDGGRVLAMAAQPGDSQSVVAAWGEMVPCSVSLGRVRIRGGHPS